MLKHYYTRLSYRFRYQSTQFHEATHLSSASLFTSAYFISLVLEITLRTLIQWVPIGFYILCPASDSQNFRYTFTCKWQEISLLVAVNINRPSKTLKQISSLMTTIIILINVYNFIRLDLHFYVSYDKDYIQTLFQNVLDLTRTQCRMLTTIDCSSSKLLVFAVLYKRVLLSHINRSKNVAFVCLCVHAHVMCGCFQCR